MLSVCGMLGAAMALTPPTLNPSSSPPDALLSGPAVEPESVPMTLVKRGFDGALEDIGAEPEAAAIEMLLLSDEQKATYEKIHSDRLALFDSIIRSNYGLLVEIGAMQGETDGGKWFVVLNKMLVAMEAYTKRGSLLTEMKPHLTPQQHEQALKLVREYWTAKMETLRREHGENAGRWQLGQHAKLEALGQMVRESIERQVALARQTLQEVADQLDLTGEQVSKAEAIFEAIAVKEFQNIEPSEAERAQALRKFTKILTPPQRQKLLGLLIAEWRASLQDAKKPDPPATQPMNPS